MPDNRKFWTRKDPELEWSTISFNHHSWSSPIRLVLNTFNSEIFGGETYIPCAANLTRPDQGADPVADASVSFSRALVGDEFKKALGQITGGGWLSPITCVISTWWDSDRVTPSRSWDLFVAEDGITMNRESVTVSLSDSNPMVRSVAVLYDPAVFTGLQLS